MIRPWLLLFATASWLLPSLSHAQTPPIAIENIVDVGSFVDTQSCYSSLIMADADGDRRVDREEYVDFVDLLAGDRFSVPPETTFADLPLILQLNFNTLACLCRNVEGAAEDCCIGDNAAISNEGAAPTETPTPAQEAYLFTVCLFTETTVDRVLESGAPSVVPTTVPSFAPSGVAPSVAPSAVPSVAPSAVPSVAPTVVAPTLVPGVPTVAPTTATPTVTPAPSPTPGDEVVTAFYEIGVVPAGINPDTYTDDLVAAMDIVAEDVASEGFSRRQLLRQRKLAVTVLNTTVDGTIVAVCPEGISSDTECRDVQSSVVIFLSEEDDPDATAMAYEAALNASIQGGALRDALNQVNPDSPVTVLTGPTTTQPPAPSPSEGGDSGLSAGGIAGIVIASVVVVGGVGFFVYSRNRQEKESPYFPSEDNVQSREPTTLGAVSPEYAKDMDNKSHDSSSNAGSSGWSSSAGVSSLNTADSMDKGALAALGMAGGAAALAGSRNRDGSAKKIDSGDVPELPNVTREDLDTAIESGDWAAVGATAALLAAASDSQSMSSSRKSSASKGSQVSSIDAQRAAELDHLVDAGDWEGVVLAAARFEQSEGDSSTKSGSGSKTTTSQSRSLTGSHTAGSSRSATGSVGTSSAYSQGGSTSLSESPSKAAKRAEIRQEVEALVRRVVPDEIDNVDEMMLQFKGREEELVETLRTMQERSIAQRARAAERKSAKIQARDDVRRSRDAAAVGVDSGGGNGLSGGAVAGIAAGAAVAGAGVAAAVGAASKDDKDDDKRPMHEEPGLAEEPSSGATAPSGLTTEPSSDALTSEDDKKRRRTALELAIEAGDWEAVGEAAAMMSDASVTTGSMSHTDYDISAGSQGSTTSSKRRRTGVNAERAAELDAMIDKGDWSGVVAAASSFSKKDKTKSDKSTGSGSGTASGSGTGDGSGSGSGSRRSWFGRKKSKEIEGDESVDDSSKAKALKEEQDALAQAEVWMAIAEQSKTEGSNEAAGASDAADWAIARSLSALRHAEAGGELKADSTRTKGAVPSSASVGEDSTGDKSV